MSVVAAYCFLLMKVNQPNFFSVSTKVMEKWDGT
jgi:hypothetical protein